MQNLQHVSLFIGATMLLSAFNSTNAQQESQEAQLTRTLSAERVAAARQTKEGQFDNRAARRLSLAPSAPMNPNGTNLATTIGQTGNHGVAAQDLRTLSGNNMNFGAPAPFQPVPLNRISLLPINNTTNGSAGCATGVSSPAIGANVPATYFGVPTPGTNPSFPGAVQLLTSGVVDTQARTVTIPLYEGRLLNTGETVYYIATDTTDQTNAAALGINHSGKLAFGEVGRGTRTGTLASDGMLIFGQGRVDFSPDRNVVPAAEPNPFPPAIAQPGSVGDAVYSPLVKILNAGGHIYNMPIVAMGAEYDLLNADGTVNYDNVHDTVVDINFDDETVTLDLAAGFSFGRPVLYISTDSNSPVAAALEGSTLAPGLDDIMVGADDSLFSAVERIFITINGARGCENPQRQGLNAAVTDGGAPFNVLGGIPTIAPDYSPLWDANIGEWTQEAIDNCYRSRLIDEFQILSFVENGFMTGPGGADYGSTGIIINCPIVHRFL